MQSGKIWIRGLRNLYGRHRWSSLCVNLQSVAIFSDWFPKNILLKIQLPDYFLYTECNAIGNYLVSPVRIWKIPVTEWYMITKTQHVLRIKLDRSQVKIYACLKFQDLHSTARISEYLIEFSLLIVLWNSDCCSCVVRVW